MALNEGAAGGLVLQSQSAEAAVAPNDITGKKNGQGNTFEQRRHERHV